MILNQCCMRSIMSRAIYSQLAALNSQRRLAPNTNKPRRIAGETLKTTPFGESRDARKPARQGIIINLLINEATQHIQREALNIAVACLVLHWLASQLWAFHYMSFYTWYPPTKRLLSNVYLSNSNNILPHPTVHPSAVSGLRRQVASATA